MSALKKVASMQHLSDDVVMSRIGFMLAWPPIKISPNERRVIGAFREGRITVDTGLSLWLLDGVDNVVGVSYYEGRIALITNDGGKLKTFVRRYDENYMLAVALLFSRGMKIRGVIEPKLHVFLPVTIEGRFVSIQRTFTINADAAIVHVEAPKEDVKAVGAVFKDAVSAYAYMKTIAPALQPPPLPSPERVFEVFRGQTGLSELIRGHPDVVAYHYFSLVRADDAELRDDGIYVAGHRLAELGKWIAKETLDSIAREILLREEIRESVFKEAYAELNKSDEVMRIKKKHGIRVKKSSDNILFQHRGGRYRYVLNHLYESVGAEATREKAITAMVGDLVEALANLIMQPAGVEVSVLKVLDRKTVMISFENESNRDHLKVATLRNFAKEILGCEETEYRALVCSVDSVLRMADASKNYVSILKAIWEYQWVQYRIAEDVLRSLGVNEQELVETLKPAVKKFIEDTIVKRKMRARISLEESEWETLLKYADKLKLRLASGPETVAIKLFLHEIAQAAKEYQAIKNAVLKLRSS